MLNNLPFLKWEINYQIIQTNSKFMVLIKILIMIKGSQQIRNYLHSYCWPLNNILQFLKPSLYFSLGINLTYHRFDHIIYLLVAFYHIVLSLYWSSYPSPHHGLFYSHHLNFLIFLFSPCCCCILLITLYLQYYCSYTCRDPLLIILVAIVFYLYLYVPVIFFSFNFYHVNIRSPITVVIIFSLSWFSFLCPNSFASSCCNHRHSFTFLFTASLLSPPRLFTLLISLHLSLLQSFIPFVKIT